MSIHAVITSHVTERANDKGYIAYKIQVKVDATQWEITKRYNQFFALNTQVGKLIKSPSCPPLPKFPPKILMNMLPGNIQKRQTALQEWMNVLLSAPELVTAKCVQDFFEVTKYMGTVYAPPPQPQNSTLSLNLGPVSLSMNATPPPSQMNPPMVSMSVQSPPPQQDFYQQPSVSMHMGGPDMTMHMGGPQVSMNLGGPQMHMSTGPDMHMNTQMNMNMGTPQMNVTVDPFAANMHMQPQANISFNTSSSQMHTSTGFPQVGLSLNLGGSSSIQTHQPPMVIQQQPVQQQVYSPPPVQSGWSQAISDSAFEDFLNSFKDQAFSSDKISFIKNEFKNHYFTTEQGLKLLDACSFSDEYVEAAIALHPRTVDPTNFHKLITMLPFDSDRKKVRSALNMA